MVIRGGLTLVEVLAVVVILSLLAVTLVVGLGGRVGEAKHQIARTQVVRLMQAVESFQTLKGRLPDQLDDLVAPNTGYGVDAAQLKDPWNRPYHYLVPGPSGQPFEITSLGADGQAGGSGDGSDISSANLSGGEEH